MPQRFVAVCLLVSLCACGGPVRASNCEILSDQKHGTVLRAMLTNGTGTPVKHVGVLVEGTEYEFPVWINARESTRTLVGLPYTNGGPSDPVKQNVRGRVWDFQCWARAVVFADGSTWSVSPL